MDVDRLPALFELRRVGDAAGRELTTELHERWNQGVPPPRALREAQALVRGRKPEWKNPQAWAGWVLWGVGD